jgi:cell division protein FtsL
MNTKIIYTADLPDQKAIKPVDFDSLKKYFILFFLVIPFFILSFLILKTNLKIYSIGKEIRKLEYESKKIEDEKIKLIMEKESLLHPEKIEKKAEDYGLKPIDEKKVIIIYEP